MQQPLELVAANGHLMPVPQLTEPRAASGELVDEPDGVRIRRVPTGDAGAQVGDQGVCLRVMVLGRKLGAYAGIG
ncbi:hypothetical protein AFR_26050 [Actinoplanes friuliensis DSM 7358]|uniref:Uncharacterized protein n=1 Tax=Actinoplanes friuliensis DSM 7358 TaxID=1246995 RepID=U5W2W5_9ACTN|nr:hypothetical protein AFR_26050 [Actinoplanes friuliensis DSM 7358]